MVDFLAHILQSTVTDLAVHDSVQICYCRICWFEGQSGTWFGEGFTGGL